MKSVSADELDTKLDEVLNFAQVERVLISRSGKPCAVLVGVEGYDAEDLRWATSPDFWQMIGERRSHGNSIPLADVEARLQIGGEQTAKRAAPTKNRKRK